MEPLNHPQIDRSIETVSDPAILHERYQRNVSGLSRAIPLVFRPKSEQDVAAVVRQAQKDGLKLYPISTGRNWGLGSKLPVEDGCIIVDLSGMDRILEVNEGGRYALIEPGVTQGQLAAHLEQHHPDFTMNVTGSFSTTSVLGNVLDRGDGMYARVDDLLGARGILGDGSWFEVGGRWGATPKARHPHVMRHHAGPDLTGLFSQSNFAITTCIAFRIMRRPQRRYLVWGQFGDTHLHELMDRLDYLGEQGLFRRASVSVSCTNRFTQGKESTSHHDDPCWGFSLVVDGTHQSADCCSNEVTSSLKDLCVAFGRCRLFPDPEDREALPEFLWHLVKPLQGTPDDDGLRLIYQMTNTPPPRYLAEMDVDRTSFGMRSMVFAIAPTGSCVRDAANIVAGVTHDSMLNIKQSFLGDGRAHITIHFVNDRIESVRAAEKAEEALWVSLAKAGYLPYRSSIHQMKKTIDSSPVFFELVGKLKMALDPHNIIAPGRYCAPLTREQS